MENYYQYWNKFYTSDKSEIDDGIKDLKLSIQDLLSQGYISHDATIDGIHEKQILIYEHTDPIEGKEDDFRAICLDKENIHRGNFVTLKDGRNFLAITRNDWNGAYNKYRVRQMYNHVEFNNVKTMCAMAKKGDYNESSYVNEANVFEDKELKAIIISYTNDTKLLTLFDDVLVDGVRYKVVKIDSNAYKDYGDNYGALQIVLIDTPFGEIMVNDRLIKGVVMSARVKDKILNSISREILCNYDEVKRGDYVDFTYDRNEKGKMVTDTYLTVNNPTMGENYDRSLMYLCENSIKLLDNVGTVVNVPVYYENNRVRIDKVTETDFIKLKNSSYLIMLQQNELTKKLCHKVRRVLINGEAYDVTGFDTFTPGILALGLELGQIDSNDDDLELGVANYKSQMEEINGGTITPPTSEIIEKNGYNVLYKGYSNEYTLQGISSGVTWIVDVDWIEITQDGNKCWLKYDDLQHVGKTVVLTAEHNGNTYTKTIELVTF